MPTCENSHTCTEDYNCKSFPDKKDCPFKAPGYPQAASMAVVLLNDLLAELNACETITTSQKHFAGNHGAERKSHIAITGPEELITRLHDAIILGRGKRS